MADISYGFAITGADDVARSLQTVAGQLERLTTRQQANAQASRAQASATGSAATAFAAMNAGTTQAAQRIQSVASSVQSLVSALGSRDRTAGLVASVAGATTQFASMGAAIGGPAGGVIGAVIGLTTSIASLVAEQRDGAAAAAEFAQNLRDMAAAAVEARAATTRARNIAAAAGGTALDRLALSDTSDADLRSERETRMAALRRIDELSASNDPLRGYLAGDRRYSEATVRENVTGGAELLTLLNGRSVDDIRREMDALDAEIESRMRAAADARDSRSGAGAAPAAPTPPTRRRGGGRRRPRPTRGSQSNMSLGGYGSGSEQDVSDAGVAGDETEAAVRNLAAQFEAEVAAAEAVTERNKAAADAALEHARAQAELAASAREARDEFGKGYTTSIDEVVTAWREANAQLRGTGQAMISQGRLLERGMVAVGNNITETFGGTMVGAFQNALGAWLDGSKSFVEAAEDMAKGVLKALVMESIVQAVVETARGVADLAGYRYDSAALHFAAAGAWAAVGVVAGGVGAAVGAFGGGGGGGAGQGAQSGPSSRELAGRQQPQGGGTTVINVYPGGFVTRDEVAGGVVDALNYAARNGRTVDSRLMRR